MGPGTPERARYSTKQGEMIADVLHDLAEFRTAQDIHAELRARGFNVGLTTVYRHLNQMVDGGTVDVLRTPGGETVYRRCGAQEHHHHLICRSCGKTVEFEKPEIERWASSIGRAAGFTDVSHTIEVFGTCSDCARKAVRRQKARTGTSR